MPLFKGRDCIKKVSLFAIGITLLIGAISTAVFTYVGIYFGVAIIVLAVVILRYIVDQFADTLFTDNKYSMSKEEIEHFGKMTIPFPPK